MEWKVRYPGAHAFRFTKRESQEDTRRNGGASGNSRDLSTFFFFPPKKEHSLQANRRNSTDHVKNKKTKKQKNQQKTPQKHRQLSDSRTFELHFFFFFFYPAVFVQSWRVGGGGLERDFRAKSPPTKNTHATVLLDKKPHPQGKMHITR